MRKFIKFCVTAAMLLIVVGLIAGIAITFAGGGNELLEMVKNGELTLSEDDFNFSAEDFGNNIEINEIEPIYDLDDVEIFKSDKEIMSGDIPLTAIQSDGVEDLDINLGGGEFFIKKSPDSNFYIQAENVEKLQIYTDNDTLHLKALRDDINDNETTVELYLPEKMYEEMSVSLGAGMVMLEDSVSVSSFEGEIGAGQMIMEGIDCNNMSVKVGAGEFVGENVNVKLDADLKIGAGHIQMDGYVGENLDVKCSMGAAEIYLANAETDFNYEVECVAGSVQIGEHEYNAFAFGDSESDINDSEIDNNASGEISIDCSMGSVVVEFG